MVTVLRLNGREKKEKKKKKKKRLVYFLIYSFQGLPFKHVLVGSFFLGGGGILSVVCLLIVIIGIKRIICTWVVVNCLSNRVTPNVTHMLLDIKYLIPMCQILISHGHSECK